MQDVLAYFSAHHAEYLQMLVEHVFISALALVAASAVSVPLGILCSHSRMLEKVSAALSGVLRIIPSLAVLILCVPVLGVGDAPAIAALTVLAIPPILINTTLAFRQIPDSIIEAAQGMGMSPMRLFFTVKAPLAFPLAFAGFRTAATEVVASATLAAYIGAGGLGVLIYTGLGALRNDLLWIGGLSVAALSLAVNAGLGAIDRHMRRYESVASQGA